MKKSPEYSPERRERLVRMVVEQRPQYPSQWSTIVSIAGKSGMTAQTLLNSVRPRVIRASEPA